MKIAICQFDIQYEKKEENIIRAQAFIEEAVRQGAKMIFFPEMSFTGFSMNTDLTGEDSQKTIQKMQEYAIKWDIAIGFGWVKMPENDENGKKATNHYTVVDEKGTVLGDYAKIHPFSYSGEDEHFSAGNQLVTFLYGGMCFGMSICYDLRFPELFQGLSKEAQVLLVPANWPAKRTQHWSTLLCARAIENQCYVVGVNCVGQQESLLYTGNSAVLNPNGDCIANAGVEEGVVIAEIKDDVLEYRRNFPTKQDRRPEMYREFY